MNGDFSPGRESIISVPVILGVSGGVDSCAAALILRERGYDPLGIRLILHDQGDDRDRKRLVGLERLGIPVVEVDGRDAFRKFVIDPFVVAYGDGSTPNPCILCNERVKFRLLFDEANRRGIQHVATGHYAGLGAYGDGIAIRRADRGGKDQSYMLYRLAREWLPRLIFPLELLSKPQVRTMVAHALDAFDLGQGDSQDICFLPERLEDFLARRLGDTCPPGPMITADGRRLGEHGGLYRYTLGQRKGLGLGGGPWFVADKDRKTNSLILGGVDDCAVVRIRCSMLRWHHRIKVGESYTVCHRYRSRAVLATMTDLDGSSFEVLLSMPVQGVAPGQSLVVYDGSWLLAGGIISHVSCR
ncbi:MAG: tRNA 2-thiouridine(34) synthase MnmA [Dethiosulfovibrio peptidovorans]|nr:MAG: tRNA 2-thiouridine(34) synthase MnmA [Dethiosulfovibrio peptidovorans]